MSQMISRRNVLRGLGAALALPYLESVQPAMAAVGSDISAHPRRMAFIFVPNGVNLDNWTPRETGFGYKLTPTLEPLAKVRDEVTVISGLTHDKGRANGDGPGDHARSASVFLTGAQPRKTSGSNIRSGVSVDQAAAKQIGNLTKFPSIELGCDRGRSAGSCDSGYSCAYSSNISWASPSSPMGKETNPRAVFDRLFSDRTSGGVDPQLARRNAIKKSVLDFVSEDAKALQHKLSGADNHKLEEYLTGVREIERRIALTESDSALGGPIEFNGPRSTPREYREHVRLLCDMMVLAFQTDSTRIATFMFADAGSNRSYREVDVRDGHHELSHHRGDREKLAKIGRINQFHVEQLAYLLERLKSIKEGESTLLDNCMVCYGSAISDGNRHNNENLPIVLAGRGGGTIDPGRHIRYETEIPLCNLFVSMLDRIGAPVPYLGDSTGKLPGLQL